MSQSNSNLTTLQSLRGFAAIAVCVAHLQAVEVKLGGTALLGNWAIAGFAGVDLFFVISGFVMVWVTRAQQGDMSALPRFWLARALRIYPLWWFVLSAVVGVWMIKPEWVYSQHLVEPDLLRSYLLFPAKELPLHAVGWTLIHEVWFYVVFGILLLAPVAFLPFLLLAWGTIVSAAALLIPMPADPFLALVRHPLTLEFIMGAFVGILATKGQFPRPLLMLQVGCFVLLLGMLAVSGDASKAFGSEWTRVALLGLPAALIVWGWVGLEQTTAYRAPRWSCALGDWSYALYLVHVLVIAALGRLCAPLAGPGILDNLVFLIVAICAAVFAAFILHVVLERPLQKLSGRLTK